MAKRPAISKDADATWKSDEFQTFESGLRNVPSVSKKDLDAKVEPERDARKNGNGHSPDPARRQKARDRAGE